MPRTRVVILTPSLSRSERRLVHNHQEDLQEAERRAAWKWADDNLDQALRETFRPVTPYP